MILQITLNGKEFYLPEKRTLIWNSFNQHILQAQANHLKRVRYLRLWFLKRYSYRVPALNRESREGES